MRVFIRMQTLNRLFRAGYSRIPIYERDQNDVVGLILAKDLLFIDPEDELPMRNFMSVFSRKIERVWPDQKLHEVILSLVLILIIDLLTSVVSLHAMVCVD